MFCDFYQLIITKKKKKKNSLTNMFYFVLF